jgi:hypothetical protein
MSKITAWLRQNIERGLYRSSLTAVSTGGAKSIRAVSITKTVYLSALPRSVRLAYVIGPDEAHGSPFHIGTMKKAFTHP